MPCFERVKCSSHVAIIFYIFWCGVITNATVKVKTPNRTCCDWLLRWWWLPLSECMGHNASVGWMSWHGKVLPVYETKNLWWFAHIFMLTVVCFIWYAFQSLGVCNSKWLQTPYSRSCTLSIVHKYASRGQFCFYAGLL